MNVKSYVRLRVVTDQYSPEELVFQIGLQGDSCWRIGDLRRGTAIKEKANGWQVESALAPGDELIQHIQNVLSRILGHETKLFSLSLSKKVTVELCCAVYTDGTPPLYFGSEIISQLAAIGANFDIDLYGLS